MTKATAIVGVTCFLVLSATVYVALSDKDHSTTDISSPSATTDLHVDKVKDSDAGILGAVSREMVGLGKHTAGSGQCNKPQLSKIDRSIKAAAPKIQYAIDNKNAALWTKWFGQPTSENPDYKVDDRLKDGLKKMEDRDWQPLCCPVSGGDEHCKTCQRGDGRLASVDAYKYLNDQETDYVWNQITICADTFSSTDMKFGFVMFHETVHMISAARDGNGDYSKKNHVSLALNNPDLARLTSNSYMFYTMQNSLSHDDYEKSTKKWGNEHACTNEYLNCGPNKYGPSTVQTVYECASGTLPNGQYIGVVCCEACLQFDQSALVATTELNSGSGSGSGSGSATQSPSPSQSGACADKEVFGGRAWSDSAGDSCADYKKNNWCSGYGTGYKNAALVANQACCTCGGGN